MSFQVFRFAFSIVLLLGLLFCGQAKADLLNFAYSGELVEIESDPNDSIDPSFSNLLGQQLRYEFSFDSDLTDFDPTPEIGLYEVFSANTQAILGGSTFNFDDLFISVFNDHPSLNDQFFVGSSILISGFFTSPEGNQYEVAVGLGNRSPSDSVFNSDSLPTTPPDPQDFETSFLRLSFVPTQSSGGAPVSLTATNISVNVIPEPGSGLVFIGLICLAAFRKRKGSGPNYMAN